MTASAEPRQGPEPVASLLGSIRRVWVGSMNPPKIEAVKNALASYAAEVRVEGVAVPSEVPEQPVGLDEIMRGARNRAARAAEAGGAACDLAIGIEDGLLDLGDLGNITPPLHVNIGCAAVTDGHRESFGFSSAFAYPPHCTRAAIRDREPIGGLFDSLWAAKKGEQTALPFARDVGNVGKLTLGVLPRAEYARHAVLCALVSFLHPELYGGAEADAAEFISPEGSAPSRLS